MPGSFNTLIDALKASFKPKLVLRYTLLLLLQFVVAGLIALVVFLPAFWAVAQPFLAKLPLLETNPLVVFELIGLFLKSIPFMVGVLALACIIFFVLQLLWSSLVGAVQINLAKNFLSNAKVFFMEAWDASIPKWFAVFKANFLLSLLFSLIYVIIMLPVILAVVNFVSSLPPVEELFSQVLVSLYTGSEPSVFKQLDAVLNLYNNLSLLYTAIGLLLLPFTWLVVPSIILENIGAVAGLKRAWRLSKNSYLKNLVFAILASVILIIIGLILAVVATIVFIVVMALLLFIASGGIGVIISIVLFAILLLLLFAWMATYGSLAAVKFYEFALANMPVSKKKSTK